MRLPHRGLLLPALLTTFVMHALPSAILCAQNEPPGGKPTMETALLDILLEQGVISPEQYDSVLALARERVEAEDQEISLIEARLQRLAAPSVEVTGGAPGKLLFKSPDGKWSLGVKGLLQARLDVINSDDDSKDSRNYSIPLSRLAFEGTAGAENVTYKLEMNMATQSTSSSTSSTTNFALRDAFINWAFDPTDAVKLGQFKFPFGLEEQISSSALSFAERSIASKQFAPSYEPGAMVWGTAGDGDWEYYVASSNGQGTGASNPSGSSQDGLRSGFRVAYNPLGSFIPQGPSFQTLNDGSTKLSLGFAANQNVDSSGLNTVTPGTDTTTTNWEAQLMSGPWSVLTEVYDQTSDPQSGSDVDNSGSTVQVGWFLVANRWELVARRSTVDLAATPDQTQTSIGVNYYVDRLNGKWQLDLNQLDNQGSAADSTQVQLQYQLVF